MDLYILNVLWVSKSGLWKSKLEIYVMMFWQIFGHFSRYFIFFGLRIFYRIKIGLYLKILGTTVLDTYGTLDIMKSFQSSVSEQYPLNYSIGESINGHFVGFFL